jgi:hypothetical protein
LSDALPATPVPYVEPCCGPALRSEPASSHAAGLVDALRRAKKAAPVIDDEISAAQDSLERRIRAHLARGRVQVTLTDNRYTMISVRRITAKEDRGRPIERGVGAPRLPGPRESPREDRGRPSERGAGASSSPRESARDDRARAPRARGGERRYEVRLHHMFADADPVITRALAHYIADNDADASRILGDFIDANADHVRGRSRRAPAQLIFTAGEHHDLRAIFDELNARYFENRIEAAITWGARAGRPRRRNSIKMGSYSVEDRLIRIHRSLDRAFVPRFFVAWIVFHEMLHQVHDIRVKNGRREFHSKAFLADEAGFELYEQAKIWERRHLDALLTY